MPNSLTATGITVATQVELINTFSAAYRQIYGSDINLDSNSPDAQMMMIFIQAILDVEDLLVQIYSTFDPDNAVGTVLDQRCAINGIQRLGGTNTVTNVTITTSQAVQLWGLDQQLNPPYTVADTQGNQWQLVTTNSIATSGTYVLVFQAAVPGAVFSVTNAITVPVTVVLGVTSINNPTTYTTLGINQESDAALKIRRQQSVSLSSQGYLAGLLAALENLPGITFAQVYENNGASPDADSIPGHSIWVIVAGSASNPAIANVIYNKRNAGCGMKGSTSVSVLQADGTSFLILWDFVSSENLFIKFTASSLNGVNPPNITAIINGLSAPLGTPGAFVPGVNQQVNINDLATLVQEIDSNTLVTSAGFSTTAGGSYTTTLTPTTKNLQFAVNSANIIVLPIILNPTAPSTPHSTGTIQFSALGGHGTYAYSIHTNNSGGSINSSSGLYSAGTSGSVTDVVRVTDGLGNTTDVNVTVT